MQPNLEADLLCVYGSGELTPMLKQWLQRNEARQLIFMHEGDSASTSLTEQNHPRARHLLFSPDNEEELCKQIAWESVFSSLAFFAFPTLEGIQKERSKQLFEKIAYYQLGVNMIASDYGDMGKQLFSNITTNIKKISAAKKGAKLSLPKGLPAIICGAGPSLTKNVQLLRGLSEKALIFGGGSSLRALSKARVVPHFSAAIDPAPPYAIFAEQTAFETPFFYQHRLCQRLHNLVHSTRLWMADQGALALERWLCEGLEDPSFDGGWNVATFSLAIARKLGCNPIILVGMDLCSPKPGDALVPTEDHEGKKVYARRDWLIAKEWIEEFAANHSDIKLINATEGGLGFKGVPAAPLASVIATELKTNYDLHGMVHAALQHCPLMTGCEEVARRSAQLEGSVKRTHALCVALVKEFEDTYPAFPCQKGSFILKQVELEEELATQKMLIPIWEVWKHLFARQIPDPNQGLFNQCLFYKRVIEEIYGPI